MKYVLVTALVFWISVRLLAQSTAVNSGASLPGICLTGTVYITTSGTPTLYTCTAPNTWTTAASVFGFQTGDIIFISSGTCRTGFTEVSALNGKMWRGTVAANMDVGTTGGSDTITPTVASLTAAAQTFTGNSVTSSAVSAGTPAGTNGTASFTPAGTNAAITAGTPAGTVSALTTVADSTTSGGTAKAGAQTPTFSGSALGTHTHTFTGSSGTVPAEVFTGSALGTHTHTTTATGTNGTSAVTGTLNNFDNRSAFINLIGCVKQ